ncbi:MAG TPA: alpha/beta hydrolase family protein [Desulfotignum sp.]|nr:alpha/beta hydrolase family protein [Desulfotignum sp.]
MEWVCRHKWLTAIGVIVAAWICFQTARSFFLPREHQIRHALHQSIKNRFPEAAQALEKRYGIKPFKESKIPSGDSRGDRVVLVHGLDDPGIIWQNLAPFLSEKGYQVLVMTYPNDQAIAASTRFFFEQMRVLATTDSGPVSVVAHSMGGLVARDMLTSPAYAYAEAATARMVPAVRQLIMVGTPNHGTQMARFRIFTEIRDQVFHLFKPDTHWLHCLLDGTGAAGVDLLPDSRFLTQLNQSPLLENTQMHVIAGILCPWLHQRALKNLLGDGLVSVDSAALQQVPVTRVNGSHFSIIRNLSKSSTRMPPAIPVILRLLKNQLAD